MGSRSLLLALLPLLPLLCAALSCVPCDRARCAPLPAGGCAAGTARDPCGCCARCAPAEGEPCGGGPGAPRCGPGMECVRSKGKRSRSGTCACKSSHEVCGSDGITHANVCALRRASLAAQKEGRGAVSVQNKGRCAAAPVIITPPGLVYNMSGSQVFLSCEAVGVPTPVLTWKKILGENTRAELLPGDRDNLAVQMRGGPEKHQVTGWVLIFPLTKEEEGSYECHAANPKGEAFATGEVHLVQSVDDIISHPGGPRGPREEP